VFFGPAGSLVTVGHGAQSSLERAALQLLRFSVPLFTAAKPGLSLGRGRLGPFVWREHFGRFDESLLGDSAATVAPVEVVVERNASG
jgi:hypothetical protein